MCCKLRQLRCKKDPDEMVIGVLCPAAKTTLGRQLNRIAILPAEVNRRRVRQDEDTHKGCPYKYNDDAG